MLSTGMKEANEKRIVIQGTVRLVDDLAYSLCTGEVRMGASALELFNLSDCYQLTSLKYECMDRLVNELKPETLVSTVHAFEKCDPNDGDAMEIYSKLVAKFRANTNCRWGKYTNSFMKNQKVVERLPLCWKVWNKQCNVENPGNTQNWAAK